MTTVVLLFVVFVCSNQPLSSLQSFPSSLDLCSPVIIKCACNHILYHTTCGDLGVAGFDATGASLGYHPAVDGPRSWHQFGCFWDATDIGPDLCRAGQVEKTVLGVAGVENRRELRSARSPETDATRSKDATRGSWPCY